MTTCEICSKEAFKYKCPNCTIKYCSLSCWKTHQESQGQCQKPLTTEPIPTAGPMPVYFKTEDTVDRSKLELLRNSSGLKETFKNPHLRNLLREVDTADNAWMAISAAMNEPLFLEFADEVLKIIEPDENPALARE